MTQKKLSMRFNFSITFIQNFLLNKPLDGNFIGLVKNQSFVPMQRVILYRSPADLNLQSSLPASGKLKDVSD